MGELVEVRRSLVPHLIALDIWVVRLCVASARTALGRSLAVAVSRIGNGGIYPALAALMIVGLGARGLYPVIAAAINVALMHSVYPTIKRRAARLRPFQAHSDLKPLLATLDEHSFPSGHVMTLTAALVPIVIAIPGALSLSVAAWCAMAWARLASAHHYPSDVFAGAAIAIAISYPLSRYGLVVALPG
jgi:undecaprenyl-diphosphatase